MTIKKVLTSFFVFAILFLSSLFSFNTFVVGDSLSDLQNKINEYQNQINSLKSKEKTLSNEISKFDAQISITQLKISQTQEKIDLLSGRIGLLEDSLGSLNKAFSARVVETYKMARVGEPVILLLTSDNLGDALSRFNYLKLIQISDRDLFERLQKAQIIYKDQKTDAEELKSELKVQQNTLAKQKQEKSNLLKITRSSEQRYQELLASARAELAVAQLGQGNEKFMRDVSEGETIGNIIPSASGCSSGAHLHYEVHEGNNVKNPNDYLRSISFSYNYGPDLYGYYGTINPHGGWNWPMNEPIEVNQAFGSHGFASAFYPGGVHNGFDLDSGNGHTVKAVKAGKLYGGSYTCGGKYPGTLYYAKVEQEGGMISWYLHMIPQ